MSFNEYVSLHATNYSKNSVQVEVQSTAAAYRNDAQAISLLIS